MRKTAELEEQVEALQKLKRQLKDEVADLSNRLRIANTKLEGFNTRGYRVEGISRPSELRPNHEVVVFMEVETLKQAVWAARQLEVENVEVDYTNLTKIIEQRVNEDGAPVWGALEGSLWYRAAKSLLTDA